MKSLFSLVIALLILSPVFGQEKTTNKRFVNHTEVGGLFGRVKYGYVTNGMSEISENKISMTIQTYQGIRLNDRLSTGLGVGLDWYKGMLINPVSAGARYDLTHGKTARLYATADAGYGFTWFHDNIEGHKTRGGLMINPGFGIKYGKPGGAAFTIGLGWKRQQAEVDKPPFSAGEKRFEERVYNRLSVRLGMVI